MGGGEALVGENQVKVDPIEHGPLELSRIRDRRRSCQWNGSVKKDFFSAEIPSIIT